MIRAKHIASFTVLAAFGLMMAAAPAAAQESDDPDRIRFRIGADHGVGIGFPEVEPRGCTGMAVCYGFGGSSLVSAHGSGRFGVQFNRHFALSISQSIWVMSDALLGSSQLMAEWMPIDILQLGIAAGYDYGVGPSATLRVAVNLAGRQSGARRDGLMLVLTSHATVDLSPYTADGEELLHGYTLGLGYDFY